VAGRTLPADSSAWSRQLLGARSEAADYLDYHDVATGSYRRALLMDDRLTACIFTLAARDAAATYCGSCLPEINALLVAAVASR
jgi:hypothetical protein